MGGVMEAVWETLLPSMAPKPIEPDTTTFRSLAAKLDDLSLPLVEGESQSPVSERLAQRKFQVFDNEVGVNSVSFDLHGKDHRITIEMNHGMETLNLGSDNYTTSKLNDHLPYTQNMRSRIGASGAWVEPNEYQAKIYLTETPASILYTFRFENNRMNWTSQLRHSLFGPRKLEILKGGF
jgi:hypothetical protein